MEHRIRFSGGFFRLVSNWNLLVPTSAGEIEVQPYPKGVVIVYHLRFYQLTAALVVLAGLLLSSLIAAGGKANGLAVFIFGFLALPFVLSEFFTLIRFPRWIWRTLAYQHRRK